MRKFIYGLLIFILSGYLISCESDVYSCDPLADDWVKENLIEVQIMTRSSWLKLNERESVKKAAYVAFYPEIKKKFWADKIIEVINDFSWNEKEKDHLSLLLDYVNKTDIFNRKEVSEDFELFVYKWNEYAVNELNWTRKLIYAITANGNRLLSKSGDTAGTSDEEFDNKTRMKTNSEDSGYPNCSCSQQSDWCDIFGEIPPWVLSCSGYNCKQQVKGCGTLWEFPCDGICKEPIA